MGKAANWITRCIVYSVRVMCCSYCTSVICQGCPGFPHTSETHNHGLGIYRLICTDPSVLVYLVSLFNPEKSKVNLKYI